MASTDYYIHSNAGFIGLAACSQDETRSSAHLIIYEAHEHENGVHLEIHKEVRDIFIPAQSDMDMLRNLMQQAIPSFRTNGMKYHASSGPGLPGHAL